MRTITLGPVSVVNDSSQDLALTPGQSRYFEELTGNTYLYVKFVGSAFLDGQAVIWSSTAAGVTLAGTAEQNISILAGVVVGAKTQNYYGWILIDGVYDEVLVNGSTGGAIDIGNELTISGGTSGRFMFTATIKPGRVIAQEAATVDNVNIRAFVRCM